LAACTLTAVTHNILHNNVALCPTLTDPDNGIINCSLGDDGVPSYEDTCSLTCNTSTGYELTGNLRRTCQSDGSWSGSPVFCTAITCADLPIPFNGSVNCSSNNQPLQYLDTCTFQCNDGYELEGSEMRQCEANGEWSGSSTHCNILHCPDITAVVTVDHVTHLTLVRVWWSVRMDITDQETTSIFVI